jgi:1-acylglycerone phosphate reductase
MTSTAKVVLITGCTDGGIGASLAKTFSFKGCRVFATARKLESMSQLSEQGIDTLQLDVTSEESIQAAVAEVVSITGRVDILVNNAGVPCVGPMVDVRLSKVRSVYETNVFGALRLVQEVVPHMARQGSGTIVNIGSVVGMVNMPFGGVYSSSKAAVHMMSHALRVELKPLGIDVVLVSPGAIRSNIGNNSVAALELRPGSLYSSMEDTLIKRAELSQTPKSTPTDTFALRVVRNVLRKRPSRWLVLGHMSGFFKVLAVLPLWLVDRICAKRFGLDKPLPKPT